ncbi:MAG TPA: CBS domain-containing protein [Ilumatobacter sp.]|nr:CBS domain-containing protein [Ilumatobacter sp.]
MASTVQDVMTTELVTCPTTATISEAAQLMRDHDIGDVLVTSDDGQLAGIVTDRDLVVRCLAEGLSGDALVADACSTALTTIGVNATIEDAVRLMSDLSLRRLPVVEIDRTVGIVTLGDLAVERDPDSALGEISAAQPTT